MKKTFILATDLDDTLVGNKRSQNKLFQYFSEQSIELKLIYLTGRHFDSANDLIKLEQLPIPDVLVCDVGCSIYTHDTTKLFKEDDEWKNKLYKSWPKKEVLKIIENLNLELQPKIPLNRRISLNISNEKKIKELCQEFTLKNLPVKTIYSSNKDLDILPNNSGKGNALLYTLNKYYSDTQTILVAGNSENDLEMLSLGYPSVIVGNAEEMLLNMREFPLLYKAKNHYASGIQEAFEFFFCSLSNDFGNESK